MPPRGRQIEMFDLTGGRQHVIGVARRLGDEQVVHDREEILAQQSLANACLVRHRHHRVGAVDDQRADRRLQIAASQRSLPMSRMFSTRTPACRPRASARGPCRAPRSAAHAWTAPVRRRGASSAGEHRQAGQVRNCIAPLRWCSMPISGRSSDGCVVAYSRAKRSISLPRQAPPCRHALRRVLPHAIDQRLVADGVARHVVVIDEAVADDDVHHGERERGVAGGFDLKVPVGRLRRARPDRIDDDDLRAAPLRLADKRPVVQVRDDRVRAPQHDEAAVDDSRDRYRSRCRWST